MTDFRRIKIQATVETAGLLLSEADTALMVQTLRDKLQQLDLAVLTIDPKEEAEVPWNDSLDTELDRERPRSCRPGPDAILLSCSHTFFEWHQRRPDGRRRGATRAGGKSGLRRAGCWLTARGGNPTDQCHRKQTAARQRAVRVKR